MPSKRSYFNGTLFRKNLSRSWPLWGGVTAVGCLMPVYILLAMVNGANIEEQDFIRSLYGVVTQFVPGVTIVYAILVAMVVWSYLYSARSVGMLHALPVDRTALFVTNTLSGFAMLLIPYAVVGGLVCVLAMCGGDFAPVAVLKTVGAVLLLNLAFFGLATFCAMLTGHVFALPALYIAFNFAAPLTESLLRELLKNFLLGVQGFSGDIVDVFCPIIRIYNQFSCTEVQRYTGGEIAPASEAAIAGFGTVAVYGLLGLALLGAAWLLYRLRHSERAGDVVAFRGLRPVFRFALALLSALTLGMVLYTLLWGALFQRGDYADAVPAAVCVAIGGLVGYYAASMLLDKSLRVFRKNWAGAIAVCVAAVVLCLCLSLDIFGAERWVPEADQVAKITVSGTGLEGTYTPQEAPEQIDQVLALHDAIVADRAHIRGWSYDRTGEEEWTYTTVNLAYTLTGGREVLRRYQLPVTQARIGQAGTFEQELISFYNDPAVILQKVQLPDGAQLMNLHVNNYYDDAARDNFYMGAEAQTIYEAMVRDALEGNIPGYDPFDRNYDKNYDIDIEMEYRQAGGHSQWGYNYGWQDMSLMRGMEHTIGALEAAGVLTRAQLADWAPKG